MAGATKQYEVLRTFRRTDPKTYVDTFYEVGDTYSGPVEESFFDPDGPDGKGPLLADKAAEKASDKPTTTPVSGDTSNKEK